MIRAILFDMDGLLLDSEVYWERARAEYCSSLGCRWREADELRVKGHNSPEWARVIHDRCGVNQPAFEIIAGVVEGMRELYHQHLPLLPGAQAVVRELAALYPLAIASSSPRVLIEFAMNAAGLLTSFEAIVSADTVDRGKPAPDVFLAAARELGYPPAEIAVFEDSTTGILAACAAETFVIAVPNPHYPPSPEALAEAHIVLESLEQFKPALLRE